MNAKVNNLDLAVEKASHHLNDLNLTDTYVEIIKVLFRTAYKHRGICSTSIGTRERNIVETNACIVNVLKRNFPFSLKLIGKVVGKHHASIIYYIKMHNDFLMGDEKYLSLFQKLNTITKDYLRYEDEIMSLYKTDDALKDELIAKLRVDVNMLNLELVRIKEVG
tara:strand:+ start:1476 stop:1970 length:495 start_codon:yes stop_codon:yes gene_type:complete